MDYLPEPDIFHDIAGHVPMHTDKAFAETLVRFGECAYTAAELVAAVKDEEQRVKRLTSIFKGMARFFWFTVEFGLIREGGEVKVYGSGLISSHGDAANALGPRCDRRPFTLDAVLAQPFEIDHLQDVLFVIDSFDQLFGALGDAERWLGRAPH